MVIALIILSIFSVLNFVAIIILFGRIDQERVERSVKDEISRNRDESSSSARQTREELMSIFKTFQDSVVKRMEDNELSRRLQLKDFTEMNESKLNEMRAIVEDKLQESLDRRLGESFKQVSESLESVYKGLGEMQGLASSVGDLKKVLTNVKTRGTWGEIQLGMLLEQILTSEQYGSNVAVKKGSGERVEFAIKLPGPKESKNEPVWLPIDAKFPKEDYERLIEAQQAANSELADKMMRQLEARIKFEAKNIRDKYLDPPNTTDFGIMYLPTEGLYAEVSRRAGLITQLQREYRVVVSGPNNLAAFLNSLQMGFKTLAIQKRSSEVWRILGMAKTEFAKFASLLEKTKQKLNEATKTIEDASSKTRNIQRKLRNVQEVSLKKESQAIDESFMIDSVDDKNI